MEQYQLHNRSNSPVLEYNDYTITFDTDGDDVPEAGETINLIVSIGNSGTTEATAVRAWLSCSDSSISVFADYNGYPNIAAGYAANPRDDDGDGYPDRYGFDIASDCTSGLYLFTLDIMSDEGSWQDTFSIQIIGVAEEPTPTLTIPGFPWLAVVPAIATALALSIIIRRRQQ